MLSEGGEGPELPAVVLSIGEDGPKLPAVVLLVSDDGVVGPVIGLVPVGCDEILDSRVVGRVPKQSIRKS